LGTVQTRLLEAGNFYVEAKDFEIYFRVGGTRPYTSCSTYFGSLFELMLKHGADPYGPITHWPKSPAGKPKSFSVLEIISCSPASSPEDVAFLVALLPKPSLLPRESQLAWLKRKLGFANKAKLSKIRPTADLLFPEMWRYDM
jgi:hypothetical protein